jgi:hypothetical protein
MVDKDIKVTKDGWVWKIVKNPRKLFSSSEIELYVLHDDDTESLVECIEDINYADEYGLGIGISVGYVHTEYDMIYILKERGYYTEALWSVRDITDKYDCTIEQAYNCIRWATDRLLPEMHESIASYMETYLKINPKKEQ